VRFPDDLFSVRQQGSVWVARDRHGCLACCCGGCSSVGVDGFCAAGWHQPDSVVRLHRRRMPLCRFG
jgi:hypothetical protein